MYIISCKEVPFQAGEVGTPESRYPCYCCKTIQPLGMPHGHGQKGYVQVREPESEGVGWLQRSLSPHLCTSQQDVWARTRWRPALLCLQGGTATSCCLQRSWWFWVGRLGGPRSHVLLYPKYNWSLPRPCLRVAWGSEKQSSNQEVIKSISHSDPAAPTKGLGQLWCTRNICKVSLQSLPSGGNCSLKLFSWSPLSNFSPPDSPQHPAY